MKCVTFNNLIPSHLMKFILWHDVDDSEGEVQDEGQYLDEEEEGEEVAEVVQDLAKQNQVLQV